MLRIMFVCTGNICRSPLAHRMLEKQARERGHRERIEVESSGTDRWHIGEDADPRMRKTAARFGLELHHLARELTRDDLNDYDIIFAMAGSHRRAIRSLERSAGTRAGVDTGVTTFLFREFDPEHTGEKNIPDVPDPYYGGEQGFEEVYRIVERTCSGILDALEEGRLDRYER